MQRQGWVDGGGERRHGGRSGVGGARRPATRVGAVVRAPRPRSGLGWRAGRPGEIGVVAEEHDRLVAQLANLDERVALALDPRREPDVGHRARVVAQPRAQPRRTRSASSCRRRVRRSCLARTRTSAGRPRPAAAAHGTARRTPRAAPGAPPSGAAPPPGRPKAPYGRCRRLLGAGGRAVGAQAQGPGRGDVSVCQGARRRGSCRRPRGTRPFRRARIRLERADDVNLEEALRIYREHPDECLFHMRMTNGVFEWHLAQHPAWNGVSGGRALCAQGARQHVGRGRVSVCKGAAR